MITKKDLIKIIANYDDDTPISFEIWEYTDDEEVKVIKVYQDLSVFDCDNEKIIIYT